jgi:hypothetical protein
MIGYNCKVRIGADSMDAELRVRPGASRPGRRSGKELTMPYITSLITDKWLGGIMSMHENVPKPGNFLIIKDRKREFL